MTLGVAIVGAGWMGETHANAVIAEGDAVDVIIDVDIDRAASLAGKFGARAATDLSAAEGCQAAVVATPSALHLRQSEELARMGLPLLVEKPHRFPGEDATRMREALAKGSAPFQVGMTTRFHPGVRAIADAVQAGELGDVLSYTDRYWFRLDDDTLPGWYFEPDTAGGGVLLTNGVHILDRCRWILGSGLHADLYRSRRLFAAHNVEDFALVQGRAKGTDTAVQLSLLWSPHEPGPSELAIVGTSGCARSGPDGWSIVSATSHRSGPAPEPQEPFNLQWRDFRSKVLGENEFAADDPTLDMLELTLADIETLYRLEKADG